METSCTVTMGISWSDSVGGDEFSDGGISWSDSVGGTAFNNEGFGIAYGTSGDGTPMWVATGDNNGSNNNGNVKYSYDGISWQYQYLTGWLLDWTLAMETS